MDLQSVCILLVTKMWNRFRGVITNWVHGFRDARTQTLVDNGAIDIVVGD